MGTGKSKKLVWYVLLGIAFTLFCVNEARGLEPSNEQAVMIAIVLEAMRSGVDIEALDEDYGFNPFYEGVMEIYTAQEEGRTAELPEDMFILPPSREVIATIKSATGGQE